MSISKRVLGVLSLVLLASLPVQAATIKIATVSPDGSVWMKNLRAAAAEVSERTDGRVKFKFYPGGVMGDDKAVLRKIRVGQLHGAVLTSGGLIPVDPNVQLYSLPLALRSPEEAVAVRAQFDERLIAGLDAKGFVSFGFAEVGFAYAMGQVPLTSVASVRTQKVWVPDNDPGAVRLLSGFDISGIPLSIADVLTGLQTGLINAIASPAVGTIALQWHTQVEYGMDLPLMYVYGSLVVSKRQFRKIDDADAAIVREVFRRVVAEVDQGAREDHIKAKAALGTQGVNWVQVSDEETNEWQSLARSSNDQFANDGFIDAQLYADFQNALKALRGG